MCLPLSADPSLWSDAVPCVPVVSSVSRCLMLHCRHLESSPAYVCKMVSALDPCLLSPGIPSFNGLASMAPEAETVMGNKMVRCRWFPVSLNEAMCPLQRAYLPFLATSDVHPA